MDVRMDVTLAVRIQDTADKTAGAQQGESCENVVQSGGPEGKQVDGLVAILSQRQRPIVVGLIDGVDPHVTQDQWWKKYSHVLLKGFMTFIFLYFSFSLRFYDLNYTHTT